MKHREFYEEYNEIMWDERDVIEKFLKEQYDLRYGHQRDTWHFASAVKMLSRYGNTENVTDIMLDKDRFVIFILDDAREFECFDFAYGELSKVIDALPEVEDVVRRVAESNLKDFAMNYNTEIVLCHHPFKYNDKTIVDFYFEGDKLLCCEYEGQGWTEEKSNDLLVKLRDHVKEVTLRSSDEYKSVYDFIETCQNKALVPANCEDITFTLYETNTEVNVVSIIIGENGKMVMTVEDNGEYITLRERDIRPDYLQSVEEYIEINHWVLMGFFNGHQCSLVNKINAAWRDASRRSAFGYIVYAIAKRDYSECEEKLNIDDMGDFLASIIDDNDKCAIRDVLEQVCDDRDLETILSFIGYE